LTTLERGPSSSSDSDFLSLHCTEPTAKQGSVPPGPWGHQAGDQISSVATLSTSTSLNTARPAAFRQWRNIFCSLQHAGSVVFMSVGQT
jgi:hypothetical protein